MIVFIPVGLIASLISSCARSGEREERQHRVVQPAVTYVQVTRTLPNGQQQVYRVPQQQVVTQQYRPVPQQMPQARQPQAPAQQNGPAQVRPMRRKPWQRRFKGGYAYYEESQ